jgi:hypothetical protein
MAVIEDVRPLGAELERSYEVYVHGRLKFRVKQIVYVAFSPDETVMGFAFPKEERTGLVASDPRKFSLPSPSDMRFNWVHADLAALDPGEARELVVDAWRMVVPQKLSRAYDLTHPNGPAEARRYPVDPCPSLSRRGSPALPVLWTVCTGYAAGKPSIPLAELPHGANLAEAALQAKSARAGSSVHAAARMPEEV